MFHKLEKGRDLLTKVPAHNERLLTVEMIYWNWIVALLSAQKRL